MIRIATIDDLLDIQKLNKILFELEYNNFDSTLDTSWPMSNEGEEYFKNAEEKKLSKNLCNYVWKVLVAYSRGYGFRHKLNPYMVTYS